MLNKKKGSALNTTQLSSQIARVQASAFISQPSVTATPVPRCVYSISVNLVSNVLLDFPSHLRPSMLKSPFLYPPSFSVACRHSSIRVLIRITFTHDPKLQRSLIIDHLKHQSLVFDYYTTIIYRESWRFHHSLVHLDLTHVFVLPSIWFSNFRDEPANGGAPLINVYPTIIQLH